MMKIEINQKVIAEMKNWLESAYPHEACGFITGKDLTGRRIVDGLISVQNRSTENLRRRFVIDPLDYLKAERATEAQGKTLLGVFHSHPDHPAIPSEHDLVSAQPFFSYVIASLDATGMQTVKSYQLDETAFIEEELIVNQ